MRAFEHSVFQVTGGYDSVGKAVRERGESEDLPRLFWITPAANGRFESAISSATIGPLLRNTEDNGTPA